MSPLDNGSTIVIIGGGPAGASCAIKVKLLAIKKKIDINVIIVEPKIFGIHFNQCVGVVSPGILPLLDDLELKFPYELVQRKILGYHLNSDDEDIYLPSDKHDDISFALRRNELDDFLIKTAKKHGVEIIQGEALAFDYSSSEPRNKFIVYCNSNTLKCDFICGGFGVGNGIAREFFKAFGYRPPHILQTLITKINPKDASYIEDIFGNNIRAFMPKYKPIEFGAMTPKGNHLTINVAGEKIIQGCFGFILLTSLGRQFYNEIT